MSEQWTAGYSGVSGYTVIELLTTLTVATVMVALAAPSLNDYLHRQRLRMAAWEVRSSLELGRQLALTHHTVTTVCIADNSGTCVRHGSRRLLVFADSNGNRRHDPQEAIYRYTNLPAVTVKLSASGRRFVRFRGNGESKDPGNFHLCAEQGRRIKGAKWLFFVPGVYVMAGTAMAITLRMQPGNRYCVALSQSCCRRLSAISPRRSMAVCAVPAVGYS